VSLINFRFAACVVCTLGLTQGASAYDPKTGFDYFKDEKDLVELLAMRRSHWNNCEIALQAESFFSVVTDLHLQAVGYDLLDEIEEAVYRQTREFDEIFKGKKDKELLRECLDFEHERLPRDLTPLLFEAPDLLISYDGPYQYPTSSSPVIRNITEELQNYTEAHLIFRLLSSEKEINKIFERNLKNASVQEKRNQLFVGFINSYRVFEVISKERLPDISTYYGNLASELEELLNGEVTPERISEFQEAIAHIRDTRAQDMWGRLESIDKSEEPRNAEFGYFSLKLPVRILGAARIPIPPASKEN